MPVGTMAAQRPAEAGMELVQLMAAGDEAALHRLFQLYGRRVQAYVTKMVRDPALAEEVLQDVWVAAWTGASRFRGESRVSTWLMGIAHRRALHAFRELERHRAEPTEPELLERTALLPGGPGMLAAGRRDPEAEVEAVEWRETILSALRQLPSIHQGALRLVFFQGMSLKEAAGVMGCPVGTIKSRLSHARSRLRAAVRHGLSKAAVSR